MNDKVFIVGIELNSISSKDKFETYLQDRFGKNGSVQITNGVYAIKVPFMYTAEQLRGMILAIFSNNCQLFIMKSSIEAAWNASPEVGSWLKSNI